MAAIECPNQSSSRRDIGGEKHTLIKKKEKVKTAEFLRIRYVCVPVPAIRNARERITVFTATDHAILRD